MPKPPPVLGLGSPRPREALLIHDDDDDDDRSGGHREPRSVVVGMGGRRATGDRFGDSERGREGSSVGGRVAAWSPPPRQNTLAPYSSVPVRAGAKKTDVHRKKKNTEVIELEDEDGYEVRRERPDKAAARVEVKTEPLEYSGGDSEDSRARGRAAASAPGGSRKAGKRQRESPVRRDKPRRAGGRAETGSSRKQRICKGRAAIGRHPVPSSSAGRGHNSDWRGSALTRQVGAAVSSRTRSRNSDCRKVAYGEHDEDDSEMEEVSSDDSGESRDNQQEEDVVNEKTKVDDNSDSEHRYKSTEEEELREDSYAGVDEDDNEMEEVSSDDSGESRDNQQEEDVAKEKTKVDDNSDSEHRYKSTEEEEFREDSNAGVDEDDNEMEEVSSDDSGESRDNQQEEDVAKEKTKVDDNSDSEHRYKSTEEEEFREDSNAGVDEDDNEMEEVSSNDSGESRDNQQEEDVAKEKTKVDDNSDSEHRYKSTEEEEFREDSNAGVDEEDTDDTTEEEEESHVPSSADEAGEALRRTPTSNATAGGSTRPGGDRTPPIRKKHFEGLCLVDNADTTTSAGVGVSKRTRLQRSRQRGRCLDKKLQRRGTQSQPYCIEVSDSEPEEEVPPPVQTEEVQASDPALEDDSDIGPAKKRRRYQQLFRSEDDSEDDSSSDDSDSVEDRTFRSRPKKGGASYRQQQTAAKNGCKNYEGSSSNPRRFKDYYAANAGNPANRGNLQQGDVSFKKNALFPRKGKRGKLSAEQGAYQNLFNSIFDEIENHPNGSAPAQAQQFVDTQPLLFSFGDEVEVKEERDEFMDELWGDMDSALETVYASSNNPKEGEESDGQEIPADGATLCKQGKHDLVTDDQIGIWCRRCNFIQLEIRYVMPPMGKWSEERESRVDRELDRSINDILKSMGYEGDCCIGSHRSGPVWDLVPGVREDMFPHQIEAFEFMWNKLAGGTDIEQVRNKVKTDALSGCVVSHAPGTGKTRLAITFVQSYLELFPRCSPVIIAPKGMLATWEHEFRKWNVKVPFHVLNSLDINQDGDKTIERMAANDENFAQKLSIDNYRRLLKLQSWVEGNSVIGLSYKLFTILTKEEGEDEEGEDEDSKLRQLLLQRPDLLILDEGHIPRNRNSRIWKSLAKVRTAKRVILSGTPFQNNFEELHNILFLLRGSTGDGDRGKDEDKGFWTSLKIKNVTDERVSEIQIKLDPFVHIHNGDILHKSLPGLRESVVILNPLPMQNKYIAMMEKYDTKCSLDLEYKISLASVHPFLVTRMNKLSDQVKSAVDQPSLERIRLKPYEGVKARFVYEIVRRCHSKERVLVFSQYHEPLDLISEQLSTKFNWTKDKEILQMSGKVCVKTRQSLMMAFNDMNSDAKVMLATTKACGEGIQLIGASRVVLLDVVWNPSVGRQAIGRAYRIGQEKIVYTYNLIAEGTQEKSKYDRQAQKEHMSKKLFSNETRLAEADFISSDRVLEEMTEDENLKEMFVKILPSQ